MFKKKDPVVNTKTEETDEEPEIATPRSGTYCDEVKATIAQRQGFIPFLREKVWGKYTEDDLQRLVVRGQTYMKDKKKIPCGAPVFRLAHADIFYTHKTEPRVTSLHDRPDSFVATYNRKRDEALANGEASLSTAASWATDPLACMFILNIVFPGPKGVNMNLVQYYIRRIPPASILGEMKRKNAGSGSTSSSGSAAPADGESSANGPCGGATLGGVGVERIEAFDRLYEAFLNGTDAFRDGCVKIIPRVVEGGWFVRKTVGKVPAVLGKKVKQSYIYDKARNTIEVCADIGTSSMAGSIINVIKEKCKTLTVDMTFLLQGDKIEHLPESVLGGVRIHQCDIDRIPHYDDNAKLNGRA